MLALGATPAMADDPTATMSVLHAVPETPVDVHADDELLLDDFEPGADRSAGAAGRRRRHPGLPRGRRRRPGRGAPRRPRRGADPPRRVAVLRTAGETASVRLVLTDLGVDAAVEPVGVRDDGQMAIPDHVDRVGWYRSGRAPGDAGSAVLASHVDDQGPGVLALLRTAEPGDESRTTDDEGRTTRWRVVSCDVITCGGALPHGYRSYRDNVVVVAEPLR